MKFRPFLLLSICTVISCTETKKVEVSEPEKIVEKFFDKYESDGPREALKALFVSNKYIPMQQGDSVAIKLERLTSSLGDFQGTEKIGVKTYGQGITVVVYVVKYSLQPLRFNFKFYQPGNGWRIQNFRFESDFIDELDETVKPLRLKENFDVE